MENILTIIISIGLIVLASVKKVDKRLKYVAYCLFIIQIIVCVSGMSSNNEEKFALDYWHILGFLGYNILNIIGLGFLFPPKKNK